MLFLWIFGNNVEDQLGHLKCYLFFYLTCAQCPSWFSSSELTFSEQGLTRSAYRWVLVARSAGVTGELISFMPFPPVSVRTLIPIGSFPINSREFLLIFIYGIWFFATSLYICCCLWIFGPRTNVGMDQWWCCLLGTCWRIRIWCDPRPNFGTIFSQVRKPSFITKLSRWAIAHPYGARDAD